MKCPTVHLIVKGKPLCGKKKGYGTEDVKNFKKQLQPCGTCSNLYEASKKHKLK